MDHHPWQNQYGDPVGEPLPDWIPPPPPPRTTLAGTLCELVPLDPDRHGEELFAAFEGTDRDWGYLPYGPFDSASALERWLRSDCLGDDPLFFAVIDSTSGRAVGMASYLRIAPAAGSIEVGHIHFGAPLQRTPAATEAMYLMMRNAFELGYRRYEWKCNALNTPSRCAAQRLGFSFEGIFRQALVVKGHNRDHAWYACIDKEWPALKTAFESWLDPQNFDDEGRQRQSLSQLTAPVLVALG